MPLSILYIGGTGQISLPCVEASVALGHKVTLLNRGQTTVPLPAGVETLVGDMGAETYRALARRSFDVVAQFRLFTPDEMARDIATFTGRTGQYVFISSASVYEKPVQHYLMTERTRQLNPFWEYSRNKTACETLLRDQSALRYTIVRPSHTVRTGMPIQVGDADNAIRRMLAGKPVIVAGDGSSLWTLDPIGRSRPRLRRAARQPQGARRGFPDHHRSRLHLEPDPRGDRPRLRRRGDPRPRPDRDARRLQQGVGRPADGRQVLVRPLRQHQDQERRRGRSMPPRTSTRSCTSSIAHAKERLKQPPSQAASEEDALIDRIIAAQAAVARSI